nr:uncharacterized protein LOC117279765 [Nicotiana tomentosiformis]
MIYMPTPTPKQGKEKKKRKVLSPSAPERKRPRKRLAQKPKKTSARELSSDSLNRLRDESEEEEDSELVARVRSGSKMPRAVEAVEETVAEVSERAEIDLARASEVEKENVTTISRSEDNVPKEALGVIDLSGSPSFTTSMINEAQALKGNLGEGAQGVVYSFHSFFDDLESISSEDVTGLGDLPVPKVTMSPETGGPSSSPRLVNQFPAPSVDPTRRQAIYMSIPEDARVLSTPVGIASYVRCLVTEEDQTKMNEVEAPCLFNEAQQALNRVISNAP